MSATFWTGKEKRLRSFWRLAIMVFLLFLFGGAISSAAAVVRLAVIGFSQGSTILTNNPQQFINRLAWVTQSPIFINLISGIIVLLTALITWLIMARWIDHRPMVDYGFHFTRSWWRDFGFGLLLGLLLMALIFLVEYSAGWLKVTATFHSTSPGILFWIELLIGFLFFVSVGIYEELITRGVLLRNMAEGLNAAVVGPQRALILGYLLSSLIFGILHGTNPNATMFSTLILMAAGLFLGLGYLLTGELAIPIGLHIAWNFCEGNIFGFPVSGMNMGPAVLAIQQNGPVLFTGGAFGPEAGLVGLTAILLGGWLTVWWVRRTMGKAAIMQRLAVYNWAIEAVGED
jgi:membrane protease YdiL (CAAX protease family)